MKFRLQAFALHVAGSATVITLVLGALYLGWYRWPGWYLSGALGVVPILAGVDVSLGPLITLLIASPRKPRRSLARDVSIIVAVQLAALAYGAATLWQGRRGVWIRPTPTGSGPGAGHPRSGRWAAARERQGPGSGPPPTASACPADRRYSSKVMLFIRNADVYAPRASGLRNLLIGGGKILWIGSHDELPELPGALRAAAETLDLDGARLIPGLIDAHVHVTGGGGEAGFYTPGPPGPLAPFTMRERKRTRLNSTHRTISYAGFF